jgi:hypothetical protein
MNTPFEMDEMKRMAALDAESRRLMGEMRPALEKHAPAIVAAFYDQLEKFERTREILYAKPGRVEALKGHLARWLVGLADVEYGEAYFQRRYQIGRRHVEVGLEPRFVVAAMAYCRGVAAREIIEAEYGADPQREARLRALNQVMDLDLNIMLQSYDDHRVQQFLEVTGFSPQLFENLMSGLFS